MDENLHNQNPVSRQWLDGLSTGELIRIADNYGIDIPIGLERIFIIEEILECANAEEENTKEEIIINPSYSESVLLPKQYNISYIEVKIRDPLWIFIFWEIKSFDREIHEKAADFNGYNLRIIPLNENGEKTQVTQSFTVSINREDSARYLGFAEHSSENQRHYLIKLNVLRGESELQIASSAPFNLPKPYNNENTIRESNNPLIRLSGIQDLVITKNIDRQPRIKRL